MYREIIDKNWADYLELLKGAIAIPSVKGKTEAAAPFGSEPKKVLEYVLTKAESYGLAVKIVKNAVGYAQMGNNDENYIGILGHLDVVSAAGDWYANPFELIERENRLIGRGVLDNKGPILACLFALKLLKDNHAPLEKTIRIMFGTDEESGSADIPLYLSKEKAPVFGFTPDCKFPVVYGERGVVGLDISTPIDKADLDKIGDFQGEMARDFVPDSCTVSYEDKIFQAKGQRAPSNAPEMGENAVTGLANILKTELPASSLKDYFIWLTETFHQKHFGEGCGIQFADEESGKLILTPYALKKENNQLKLSLSIRYPISITEKQVVEGVKQHLLKNASLEITRSFAGVKHEVNRPEIQKLSQVYEKITGKDGTPVTTTGGTYARSMPHIVAFGPSFPGQKGIAHRENEYMDIEDLKTIMEIYMCSIKALCGNGD